MCRHSTGISIVWGLILVCLLSGCTHRQERRNFSISNPKEQTALTDAELVDRLKRIKPDLYDDLFDDANYRLITMVAKVPQDSGADTIVCLVEVPAYSDPRRYLGQEFIVFRQNTFVAKVQAVSVVPEGLACRLISASEDAMPIRIGDGAQSRL